MRRQACCEGDNCQGRNPRTTGGKDGTSGHVLIVNAVDLANSVGRRRMPDDWRPLADPMRRQEHRFFKRAEKFLIWQGVLDGGQVVLCIGADKHLSGPTEPHGYGHA